MANQKYEAFLTVAQTHSFKEAAARMGYTQAGISYLVSTLERDLGLPLFVRDYGDTRLTSDGRDLYPLIQGAHAAEHQLETRVAELKHLESGLVRVASFTSTAIQWFPSIAKEFLAVYPQIDLKLLCIDDEQELADAVWTGDADCGFCVAPLRHDFDAIPLRHDPLLVVVSPENPKASQRFFSANDLASEPYIQLISNGRVSEMEALFKANGVEPNVRFTVDSDYAVMSMVSADLGFSVLPDLILRKPPFPLVTMRAKVEAARSINLVVRSRETASAATNAFLELTERWVAENYAD